MCCQRHTVTPLNGIAFTLQLLSAVACSITYFAPFWLSYPTSTTRLVVLPPAEYPFPMSSCRGLWAVCYTDNSCVWFWENNFEAEKSLPDWYIAVQCVFGAGLVFFVVAIFSQSVYACCRCCSRSNPCPTVVGSFTLIAGLLVTSALSVFGGFSYKEGEFDTNGVSLLITDAARLEWAFYLGISGSGAAILAAILFYADGCSLIKQYGGYSKPPTILT